MNVILSQQDKKILSIFQVIRSVRVFATLPGLIQAILQSLPDMFSIFICLCFFLLVFAMIGTTLFSDAVPSAFGNLLSALNTLFVCITQEGWSDVYREFKSAEGLSYAAAVYFMIVITGGAFIFVNLLIAVIATNMDTAIEDNDESCGQGP
ncbi:cation channel sperm-associated protein 4-like isoform X2 [Brachyhypopomus gauderio]|uniref:cation channel sperm-associated protein 4-like isoform X2 n=1 Tax=Brachyhypopomus gauderio TaxID=698409 RepID=UPI0040430B2E